MSVKRQSIVRLARPIITHYSTTSRDTLGMQSQDHLTHSIRSFLPPIRLIAQDFALEFKSAIILVGESSGTNGSFDCILRTRRVVAI